MTIATVRAAVCLLILSAMDAHAWQTPGASRSVQLGGCGYQQTFEEDFRDLNVKPWRSDGRNWIAHTPWSGDFGDAAFTDPTPGFPFSLRDGKLNIEARKDAYGRWHSGLLASSDGNGVGFGQRFGYFEMHARLPEGDGLWPAFWLASQNKKGDKTPSVEFDVLEHYGRFPSDFHSGYHVWQGPPPDKAKEHLTPVKTGELYSGFHTFGIDVEPDEVVYYFDRKETWRDKTPLEHTKPLLILINLAMGSGWPIDKAPSPSFMQIDYVRVFSKRSCQ